MRPRSPLCSHTCELVPQMMSSTSAVSKPFRSTSARSTVAATCCGCRCESAPFSALPMPRGVRQASMMKASAIAGPLIVVRRLCLTRGVAEARNWQHACMADGQLPPSDAVSPGRVVACFLCATFAPLPPRWKQGRLQLDADGIRWGPGLRRRETGLLLPNPLRVQVVRDVRGWERLHIKANAFQIVEVA